MRTTDVLSENAKSAVFMNCNKEVVVIIFSEDEVEYSWPRIQVAHFKQNIYLKTMNAASHYHFTYAGFCNV